MRVDLKPLKGGPTENFECDDDYYLGIWNSASLYAQFEAGHAYDVTAVGFRRESYFFPAFRTIKTVSEIQGTEVLAEAR